MTVTQLVEILVLMGFLGAFYLFMEKTFVRKDVLEQILKRVEAKLDDFLEEVRDLREHR